MRGDQTENCGLRIADLKKEGSAPSIRIPQSELPLLLFVFLFLLDGDFHPLIISHDA
jgi:hypothetical protein